MTEEFEIDAILAELYSEPTLQELGAWSLDASVEAAALIAQLLSA